jgi:beta-lactamase class A
MRALFAWAAGMKQLIAILTLLSVTAPGYAAGIAGKPIEGDRTASAPVTPAPDLWSSMDSRLQQGLEALIEAHGLRAAVEDGRLALAVADITDPAAPRVAALNGDRMMYAASLPKIAILFGAMDKLQRQGIKPDATLQQDIEQMIRVSSNSAATRVLEWVGRDQLIALLQAPGVKLYDPVRNGGLWVGKDYGGNPAYRRDPLHNLSHGATAMQVAHLFQLLESGMLLDAERTARMKAALGNPGIKHKFVKGLESRPEATIYRKSGTWQRFHADGALVECRGRKLVLVGLAEDAKGGDWLASVAAPMYDLALSTAAPPQRERVAASGMPLR